ncbi:hypothetical protein ACFSC4_11755 [Deinococcus malanensis]|uniref:hypothetical protein n=1 Tax=Deinococcus malanensis TaxID=1706855 RepID=UPI00362E7923
MRLLPPLTLRARLALWAALATGLATLLVAAGLFVAVGRFLRQAQEQRLLSATTAVHGRVEDTLRRQAESGVALLLGYQLDVATLQRLLENDPRAAATWTSGWSPTRGSTGPGADPALS